MSLTELEFEQLTVAIDCMSGFNISGSMYIPAQNVKALLSLYVQLHYDVCPEDQLQRD